MHIDFTIISVVLYDPSMEAGKSMDLLRLVMQCNVMQCTIALCQGQKLTINVSYVI